MDVILGLVFIFSLLSLAMIFGDRLSIFGNVDDRWLMTPFDLVTRFWEMLCEIFDRLVCFVFDHFWWVAATASGGVGVVLIALIMLSGLSQEAAAVRRDERAIMNVGGVLDHTPKVSARETLPAPRGTQNQRSSHLVDQFPTPGSRFVIQDFSRPLEIDELPIDRPIQTITESPVSISHLPDPFRSQLRLTLSPYVEIQGQPIGDRAFAEKIQQTLYDIQRDDWLAVSQLEFQNREELSRPNLREDSVYEIDRLLNSVRILPGDLIATQDLDVKKLVPENPPAGEFDIVIRLTNRGRDTLSGLVVREQIPLTAFAKDMQPQGVYRETTAVWVVNDLRPEEVRDLVLTVEAQDLSRFESWTEVSAAAAIRSRTYVEQPRRSNPLRLPAVEDDFPVIRRRPERTIIPPVDPVPVRPVPVRPDVRLRILTDPVEVDVDDVAVVNLEIRNVGDANAEGVSLRVNLPRDVDHKELNPDAQFRRVESSIRLLQPDERRTMVLRIRPTRAGRHLVTAQLMLQSTELDMQSFDVNAGQPVNRIDNRPLGNDAIPRPQPDRSFR